jgi:hypothetical protein
MKFFYGIENNYTDITNQVYSKCIVNNKIKIPSNDNIRSQIFGDPLFGILKHIKVIFDDNANQIYDHNTMIMFDISNPEKNIIINEKSDAKICFITAIYGRYEATCKKFVEQTIPTDFICFTNLTNIQSNGWIIDNNPYHITHKSQIDNDTYINSISNNNHTFNLAKYYKQNFHNIPRLKKYDIIIWLDGTIEIYNNNTSQFIKDLVDKNNNLIVFEHFRQGSLDQERAASHFERYTSTFWFGQKQPYQDIDKQYTDYINDGYNDNDFWKKISPNQKEYGLWVTCFLAFDMKKKETLEFLDEWYLQTLKYTTQDQIGFPYVCQKLNMYPYNLPDNNSWGNGHSKTSFFYKHGHGK